MKNEKSTAFLMIFDKYLKKLMIFDL